MILSHNHDCYIFTLTAAEQTSVHTDAGMTALEVRLARSCMDTE